MDQLLPCPFCGKAPDHPHASLIRCGTPECPLYLRRFEGSSLDWWNRRAPVKEEGAQVAESEGCTIADAKMLREANFGLAEESHRLQVALSFYAEGKHMLDLDRWESVSGESECWLGSPHDNESGMVEDGATARVALAPFAINQEAIDELAAQDLFASPGIPADVVRDAERYRAINTPEIHDFIVAVEREALHQRERWASEHDAGKTDADWFWLIGYLAGKALNKPEKQLHHIITTAAACLNWHAAALKIHTAMRPGIEPPIDNRVAERGGKPEEKTND